ncbi:MAG: SIMPL domain-containing protein [Burkholderiaceae bacterium]|nr:SIMPL domain-containing protein [Burkholderiaceae bacterium]
MKTIRPLCAAALLALSGLGQLQAQTVALPPPANVLQLSTEAQAEVTQDLLTISLQVIREGTDAATVQQQLRQQLDAALAEARKAERPGQVQVRTGGFSLLPRYAQPAPGSSGTVARALGIVGWQGQAELVLEGRDIAAISQLAGKLNGMTVQRVGFGLSPEAREQATAEVAAQAIQRFKQRAADYARQFGFGSYSVREVNVGSGEVSGGPVQPMYRMAVAAAPMAAEAQPVAAGKATVTVTVNGSVQMSPR